jgi:hypothetical protein
MHLILQASIGVLLLCTLSRSNEFDPYEPLIAEASQQNSQYAPVASFNTVSDGRPQQYRAVASFNGNQDGKSFGSSVVNNNGQVSQFASGFASKNQYNSPRESGSQFISAAAVNSVARTSCSEQGRICAPKSFCQNGLVRSDQISLLDDSRSECEANEVCCKIYYDAQGSRPFAGNSQVRCRSGNQKCVPAYHCVNGELTSEGLQFAARLAPSPSCESPQVCCAEARVYDSVPAAANSNPLTPEGYVISVPDRRYLPSEPEQPDREGAPDSPNESKLPLPTSPAPPRAVSTTYLPPTQPPRPGPQQPSTVRPAQPRPQQPSPRPQQPAPRPQQPAPRPTPERQRLTSPRPPITYDEQPQNLNPAIVAFPTGCPAAMNCTLKEYCTSGAMISKTIVELTPEQELFRVPMTQCRIPGTGENGFCCRDGDYEDPWPKGVLGQYRPDLLGFDDGSYKPANGNGRGNGIAAAASQVRPQKVRAPAPIRAAQSQAQPNSIFATKSSSQSCGVRDRTLTPQAPTQVNTNFGEIPWQLMVLRESTKTLLCGGVIVGPTTALVSASCVKGVRTNDVMVKTGEWQLGTNVEPKGTQLVRAKSVQNHPQFNPSTLEYDIAIINLFEPIKFDVHVAPICLDELESTPLENCIVTGWGKEVLKVHAQDAIMQYSDVYMMAQDQCGLYLPSFNPSCSYCGQTQIDACQVDTGSALACPSGGKYVIKGIYSTETGCGGQSQLVQFTQIDTNWVKQALNPRGRQIVAAAASPREVRVRPPSSYLPPN